MWCNFALNKIQASLQVSRTDALLQPLVFDAKLWYGVLLVQKECSMAKCRQMRKRKRERWHHGAATVAVLFVCWFLMLYEVACVRVWMCGVRVLTEVMEGEGRPMRHNRGEQFVS